jgi:hypothetical protein
MPIGNDLFWAREVVRELEALRTALAEHERSRGDGDRTTSVLRQMIVDRQRLLRTARF